MQIGLLAIQKTKRPKKVSVSIAKNRIDNLQTDLSTRRRRCSVEAAAHEVVRVCFEPILTDPSRNEGSAVRSARELFRKTEEVR
jgi:hypothetical protein